MIRILEHNEYVKKGIIILLAVIVLAVAVVEPPARAVAVVDDVAISIALLVLGACGVKFVYDTKEAVVEGVTGMINDFIESCGDITLDDLIPTNVKADFMMTGIVVLGAVEVWNRMIDWIKGGGHIPESTAVMGENMSVIIDGVTYYHDSMIPDFASAIKYEFKGGGADNYLIPAFPTISLRGNGKQLQIYENGKLLATPGSAQSEIFKDNLYAVPIYGNSSIYGEYFGYTFYSQTGKWLINRATFIEQLVNFPRPWEVRGWFLSTVGAIAGTFPIPVEVPDDMIGLPDIKEGDDDMVFVPSLPGVWTGNPDTYKEKVIEGVGTGVLSVPGVQVMNPDIPLNPEVPTIPDVPSDDEWKDKKGGLVMPPLAQYFPFSIPFDVIAIVSTLNAPSETPVFHVPVDFSFAGYSEEITINLEQFEPAAKVIRWGVTILFILGLTMASRKLIGG